MTVNINAANITSIRLAEQSVDPGTPASGFVSLFVDTNGDLATVKNNTGGIKIATSPASGDYTLTVDGTGTAARLNASNVFTSAQVMPAGTVGAPALTTTGDTNTGIYFPGADRMAFATGGVIRGSWTTDGLCFGSDTAADNALDDYEEGTWNPSYITEANPFGSITYTANRTGVYTKVGRLVTASFVIETSSVTLGSASGMVSLSGLPFLVGTTLYQTGAISYVFGFADDRPSAILARPGTNSALLYYRDTADGNGINLAPADLALGATSNLMYGVVMYVV